MRLWPKLQKILDDVNKSDNHYLCTITYKETMSYVRRMNRRTEHPRCNELCVGEGDGRKQREPPITDYIIMFVKTEPNTIKDFIHIKSLITDHLETKQSNLYITTIG